ncbi:hypothetical protein [Ferrimonas pelagia]|uniref:Uncharacterized protein n=1 Tax=Ferrimonas pelagia TaxID=1177826 RepID=A0ABP9EJF0_9GAMM
MISDRTFETLMDELSTPQPCATPGRRHWRAIDSLQDRRRMRAINNAFDDPSAEIPRSKGLLLAGAPRTQTSDYPRLPDKQVEQMKACMVSRGGWWSNKRCQREFGVSPAQGQRLIGAFAVNDSGKRYGPEGVEVTAKCYNEPQQGEH